MSSISHLSERLKSQIQQEQEALESQTSAALKKHGESLQRLLSAELNTTKSAIQRERQALGQALSSARAEAEAQHRVMLQRLRWLLIWPLAAVAGLCGLMLLATWLWMPTALLGAQTDRRLMADGRTYLVITAPGWTVCRIEGRALPCKPQEE